MKSRAKTAPHRQLTSPLRALIPLRAWIFICLLLASSIVHASELFQFYKGIRGLGMGGANIATVNDETALLINPAALGKLRDYYITVLDPELEGGANYQKTVGFDGLKLTNPQQALQRANKAPDQHIHERAQLFPSIVVPNFGVGAFAKYSIDAQTDSATNLFSYDYTSDYAAVFGFDFRFWSGIIKLGASTRIIDRTEVHRADLPTNSTNLTLSSLASGGMGVAEDAGLIVTVPVAWLPSLAVVYRDIGRTSYTWRGGSFVNSTTRPDSTPESVDAALAVYPILSNRLRSSLTAQYNDVLTASKETDQMRRVHVGGELNFADALFLRAGLNQHYWTAGLEIAIVNYQLQLASYGEDIGTASKPVEDRRYAIKFSIRF